jgi:hypothetical protein
MEVNSENVQFLGSIESGNKQKSGNKDQRTLATNRNEFSFHKEDKNALAEYNPLIDKKDYEQDIEIGDDHNHINRRIVSDNNLKRKRNVYGLNLFKSSFFNFDEECKEKLNYLNKYCKDAEEENDHNIDENQYSQKSFNTDDSLFNENNIDCSIEKNSVDLDNNGNICDVILSIDKDTVNENTKVLEFKKPSKIKFNQEYTLGLKTKD